MKILIVQDHLRNGGTERQACLLANAFAQEGHPTALLTFRPGGALQHQTSPAVTRLTLQSRDTGWDWFAPGLVKTAKSWQPDIVLCMGRMANCYGERLTRSLPHACVVATLRTGKALPWFFRRSLHRVHHIVANSQDSRRRLLDTFSLPPDRVSVIYNALVFPPSRGDEAPLARQRVRIHYGVSGATPVILSVGMFRPEKNQREIIEGLSELRTLPWVLWLAGDGPTRETCQGLVTERGLSDRVRFLGFTPNPSELYVAADVAVLTSQSESLSNFLIEAHAHGLPSVAYAVTGVHECGGIALPPRDRTALVTTLSQLLTDESARRRESTRVLEFAQKTFAPERQTQAYLALFAHLHSAATS